MKAVVVDDSLAMRVMISKELNALGFEVRGYPDGESALNGLNSTELPDIALVDWNMPGMNGLELIKTLRALERYNEVFLMMVTSETRLSRQQEAFAQGVDEYLTKPFTTDSLKMKLELLGFSW